MYAVSAAARSKTNHERMHTSPNDAGARCLPQQCQLQLRMRAPNAGPGPLDERWAKFEFSET